VLDVVIDQFALGSCDRALHGVPLLGEVDPRSAGLNHLDDRRKMAVRPLEAGDDVRGAGMDHPSNLSPGEDRASQPAATSSSMECDFPERDQDGKPGPILGAAKGPGL
jgi:hypothetical protein